MKTLPEHPSLDHLRQQAKALLSELRSTRPAASLADAQSSVAEQYGFKDWSELKAEVDRRRAVVEAAPDGVAEAVAAAFGLGSVGAVGVGSDGPGMSAVEQGAFAKEWCLRTDRGRWRVLELLPWVAPEWVEQGAVLLDAARAAGVDAPAPVRSADGRVVESVGSSNWRVYEWSSLGPAPSKPVPLAAAAAVGGVLARLHGLALPAAGPVSPWLTCSEQDWPGLLAAAESHGASWAGLLRDAVPTLVDVAGLAGGAVDAGEVILCHCNLISPNVRLSSGGAVTVMAWETAGPFTPRLELGYVLGQWGVGPDGSVHTAAVRALVEAYGPVARPGLDMFAASAAASLNWTASRVAAALEGDPAASAEVPGLLANPVSRDRFTRLLAEL